jgi:hypothetical protein
VQIGALRRATQSPLDEEVKVRRTCTAVSWGLKQVVLLYIYAQRAGPGQYDSPELHKDSTRDTGGISTS